MALLDPKKRSKRMQITLRLEENLISEVEAYCQWLGIARLQDFFEQAADYILKNDKDWKQEKNTLKTTTASKKISKN